MPVFSRITFSATLVFAWTALTTHLYSQDKDNVGRTLKIYIDCAKSMQADDIMETTAAVLAQQLTIFCDSKDIPPNMRILVDAFCIKSGQPLIESRFDYRIGQGGQAPYEKLRDFDRPSMHAHAESNINSIINREAWPGDLNNANTILVVLTNSRNALDNETLKTINESAKQINSEVIQVKVPEIPRPGADLTDDGRKTQIYCISLRF